MHKKIILGIDPGYDRVGFCLAQVSPNEFKILKYGLIQTSKASNIFDRYKHIGHKLNILINKYCPQELAIETVLFSKNRKTAIRVSEAKGLIIQVALSHQLKIFEYNPMQIKLSVTGDGRADKKAVEKILGLELEIPAQKTLDDAMDAIGIALTHKLNSAAGV